jgi:hypothetical protein
MGRIVALALGLVLLCLPLELHAEGRVYLLPAHEALRNPAEREALVPVLGSLGYRQLSWVDTVDLEENIRLISIVDMRADEACGRSVELEDWSARLAQAQAAVQLLQVQRALSGLAALELDLACLSEVPRQAELVAFGLVNAEAHTVAGSLASDAGMALFHRQEAQRGLEDAVSRGPDLPPPTWLAPELRERLLELQAQAVAEGRAAAFFGGTARGLWLDGKRITTGFRQLGPGRHLIQATWSDLVVAARVVHVSPGQRCLVRVTPGELPLGEDDLLLELRRLDDGVEPHPALADLLGLLSGEADDALVVSTGPQGLQLWGRGRGGLVLRYPDKRSEPPRPGFEDLGEEAAPPRPLRPAPLPWTAGGGPAVQLSSLGGGPLEGLGGLSGGFTLQGRVTILPWMAGALAVHPVARAHALPPGYDASWLWRAQIPARVGVRLGAPRPVVHPEVGVDLGALYLGRFRALELRALAVGSAGIFVPLAPRFGLRLELWGGLGGDFVAGGLQLAGEGHPAPAEHREQP